MVIWTKSKALSLLLGLVAVALVPGAQAIYEKHKGINDWHIAHLGEIRELKFVEEQQETDVPALVYSVTTDGVLSLFSVKDQAFQWRRQLASETGYADQDVEHFELGYLSRNLLVHSSKQAMLVNTAGHANLQVDFGSLFAQHGRGTGRARSIIFDFEGDLYSCFAYGNQASLYRAAEFLQTIPLDQALEPEDTSLSLLEVAYDSQASALLFVVQDEKGLKTYQVDVSALQSELVATATYGSGVAKFTSASRSAHFLLLEGSTETQVLELRTLKVKRTFKSQKGLQSSSNDDIVVEQESTPATLVDLSTGEKKQLPARHAGCLAKRQQTTENWGSTNGAVSISSGLTLALSCPDKFLLITGDGSTVFETSSLNFARNGGVKSFFRSGSDPASFVVQFEDLSTHLVQRSSLSSALELQWSREEGLSGIKQLEIIHEASDKLQAAHSFEYVKQWKVHSGSPATRVLQRYTENLGYLFKYLFSTEQVDTRARASELDIYGFRKFFVALTDYGKITSFSSLDGGIQWSSHYHREAPIQILLRRHYSREDASTDTQVVSCFESELQFLSAATGQLLRSQSLNMTAGKFMVSNLRDSESQVVIAVGRDSSGQTRVEVHPEEAVPKFAEQGEQGTWLDDQHIHFAEVDRQSGVLKGFKIAGAWDVLQLWQVNLPLEGDARILQVKTMRQTASETEHQHYHPATFAGDNLVYKFLDSNLLAVSVMSEEAGTLSIYIIDGVTGKIVHKFTEASVTPNEPVDMLLSENYFILAFKRASRSSGLPLQELSVTEFYESLEEKDTWKMLKDRYLYSAPRLVKEEYSSTALETPHVVQESYQLTVDVKAIALTQSQAHVTSKMLVLLTSNDQVYSIENALWSARRQSKADAEAKAQKELEQATTLLPQPKYLLNETTDAPPDVKSQQFPPYDGVIPQKNTRFVSYDLPLIDLKQVYTLPTRLESTSAVLITGHDLFYARVTAESTFDRLHEGFQAQFLLLSIGGLLALFYAGQLYVQRKDARESYLLK